MSRGPGRWQRLILDLVDQAGADPVVLCYAVPGALGRAMTPAEYSAVVRAAWALADRGQVVVWRGWCRTDHSSRTALLLVGAPMTPAKRPYQARTGFSYWARHGDGVSVEPTRSRGFNAYREVDCDTG